jgi:hypothetical protein
MLKSSAVNRSDINKDFCEKLMFDHDFQKDTILQALEIVKNFVIVKERILVGGMAIDFALRTKGTFLYSNDKLPDYDFVTPEFHKDAYDLANILSAKFDRVNAINALHASTMRVSVNFVVVADITYIPKDLYDKLPTVKYEGSRIIHPHYQMIDQHRALSLPYENPPRETIIGKRWTQDIERYELLNKYYPIKDENSSQEEFFGQDQVNLISYTVGYDEWDGICLGGYVGLLFWLTKGKELGHLYEFSDLGSITFANNDITIKLQKNMLTTIITDDYAAFLKILGYEDNISLPMEKTQSAEEAKISDKKGSREKSNDTSVPGGPEKKKSGRSSSRKRRAKKIRGGATPKFFNSVVGKKPRKIDYKHFEIIDNKGRMVGCHQPFVTKRIYIANLQDIMCHLLTDAIFFDDKKSMKYYIIAKDLLYWVCDKYNGLGLTTTEEINQSAKEKYAAFLPTPITYGNYNWSESYILSRERIIRDLTNGKQVDIKQPKKAHLRIHEQVKLSFYDFVPEDSSLYQFDGKECAPFAPLELPSS